MTQFMKRTLAVVLMTALSSSFQIHASNIAEDQPFMKSTTLSTDNKENIHPPLITPPPIDSTYGGSFFSDLPMEYFALLASDVDTDTLKSVRGTSKKTAHNASEPFILHKRKTVFTIRCKEDLAKFAAMHEEGDFLSKKGHLTIPVIIKNITIRDADLIHLKNATNVNLSGCDQITDVGITHLVGVKSVDLSYTLITDDAKQALRDRGVTVRL